MWSDELSDEAKSELAAIFADLRKKYAPIHLNFPSGSVRQSRVDRVVQLGQRKWHII